MGPAADLRALPMACLGLGPALLRAAGFMSDGMQLLDAARHHLAQAALAGLEGREDDSMKYRLLATQALPDALDSGLGKLTEDQLELLGYR